MAYDWLQEALGCYERAESLRPAGNDESLLRWNTCARILERSEHLRPRAADEREPTLE
ncbi:MAG: hypothetical protein ACRENI_04450 [Gemmatimonadaceae bacterium]